MKISNKNKSLALFHINACSQNKNFYSEHLLSFTNKKFDIIAITETRKKKYVSLRNNLTMNSFSFEFSPTGHSTGTLLYIANHLYIPRLDLNIYRINELELMVLTLIMGCF